VVAADDGVKEQTLEALKHIQENEIPYIVVITKIDKRNIDLNKVKMELNNAGIPIEDFGGDVPVIAVSALEGTNIDRLQELITVEAELLNLRADTYAKPFHFLVSFMSFVLLFFKNERERVCVCVCVCVNQRRIDLSVVQDLLKLLSLRVRKRLRKGLQLKR
jgi:hypothetical protein